MTIPYGYHWLEEDDIAEVVRVLGSEWITQGPMVEEFERQVAARCGARFGVAFSSGTAALHAACFSAGVRAGDEVVTSPISFVATANAAVYQGARPVFADIEPDTRNIDPDEILRHLTARTKAILPVHLGGLPADLEAVFTIAREKNLWVIEDACHALGAEWRDSQGCWQRIGNLSHSDMAIFSFHPVKAITTGEGGMVLTNRAELVEPLRAFRHHGLRRPQGHLAQAEPWRQEMVDLGCNYRITDFQCALGIQQLRKLDRFLQRRREIAARYTQAFEGLGLTPQQSDPQRTRNAWHLYALELPLERLSVDRGIIFKELRQNGMGVNVHYLPIHLHPFYRERFSYRSGDYPVAERYYERAITLPLFPRMKDQEVEGVIDAVRRVIERYRRQKVMEAPPFAQTKGGT